MFPIIKHKEYNMHVMSCAPVVEEFNYTVNYSSTCFTMQYEVGFKNARLIYLVSHYNSLTEKNFGYYTYRTNNADLNKK